MPKKLKGDIPIGTVVAALIGIVLIIAAGFIFFNQYIKPQQRPDLVLDPSSQLVCNTFNVRFTIAGAPQRIEKIEIFDAITGETISVSGTWNPTTATQNYLPVGTLVTYSGTVQTQSAAECKFRAGRDYIFRVTTWDQNGYTYTKDLRVTAT